MRILIISNLYPPYYMGGYELRCKDTVDLLLKRGHDIHVLTSNFRINGRLNEERIYRQLHLENSYLGIKKQYRVFQKIVTLLKDNFAVKRIIRKVKPNIIALWNMEGLSSTILMTLQKYDIPIVYDVSDYWLVDYKKDKWFGIWARKSLSLIKRISKKIISIILNPFISLYPEKLDLKYIYFTSKSVKDRYLKENFPIEHGKIIYCGIDIPKEDKLDTKNKGNIVKLLFSGRVEKSKGLHTVIEALDILVNVRRINNIALSIIAPQEDIAYMNYIKNIINEKKIVNHIEFLKKVSRTEMSQIYYSHDILIFPSVWAEPFALTILEGMAHGLPVISTTTGGSKEILVNEENCLVFEPENAKELAEKIELLIQNPDLRKRISLSGQKMVKDRFDINYMVNQIEEYLQLAKQENSNY